MKLITAISLSLLLLSVSVASAAAEGAKAVKRVDDAIEFFKTNGKEKGEGWQTYQYKNPTTSFSDLAFIVSSQGTANY